MTEDPNRFQAPAVGYALLNFLAEMTGEEALLRIIGDRAPEVFARQLGRAAVAAVNATSENA